MSSASGSVRIVLIIARRYIESSYRSRLTMPIRKAAPTLASVNAIPTQIAIYIGFALGTHCICITKSSPGRTRTYDPAVNSRLLYQLS